MELTYQHKCPRGLFPKEEGLPCSLPEDTSSIGDQGDRDGTCCSTAHLLQSVRVLLLKSYLPASSAATVAHVTQFWSTEYRKTNAFEKDCHLKTKRLKKKKRQSLFLTFYLQRVDLMAGAATAT